MKLALYARVSTDKCEICGKKPIAHPEAGHEFRGQDPEVQLRELREWCATHQHIIVCEYVDRGLSGKKGVVRPELNRLLIDAEKGRRDFEGVLVWRLSRFGRSFPDLIANVAKLTDAKIDFLSKQESFQLETTMGRFAFRIMCAAVEMEREVISENTRAGMKMARALGRIPGRKIDPDAGPSRTTLWRRGNVHRLGLLFVAGFLLSCVVLAQQPKQDDLEPVGGKAIGSGKVISTARIADPNELVYLNGQIVKMSQLNLALAPFEQLTFFDAPKPYFSDRTAPLKDCPPGWGPCAHEGACFNWFVMRFQ